MSHDNLEKLAVLTNKEWELAVHKWGKMDKVILYVETQEIMCRTACEWAGVPLEEDEVKWLSTKLGAMFESAGTIGPNHWLGRNARNSVEKWMGELIDQVRRGEVNPSENSALHRFSWYPDLEGNLLDIETAAVEVINIIRTIAAIAIFINFITLAVHHFPEEREKLLSDDVNYAHMFVQVVRRYYPFFPFTVALVKKDFIWNGYEFEKGTLALLDLMG